MRPVTASFPLRKTGFRSWFFRPARPPWLFSGGLLVAFWALGIAFAAHADDDNGVSNETVPATTDSELPWIDRTHASVAQSLDDTARWFDHFFGDPRTVITSEADTFIRIRLEGYVDTTGEMNINPRFHADVELPRFKNKLRLIVASNRRDEDEQPGDPGSDLQREVDEETQIGLRRIYRQDENRYFAVTGGVHATTPLNPYVEGAYRYRKPFSEKTQLRLIPTLYWENEKGFGTLLLTDLETRLDARTLMRLSVDGDWAEETDGLEWDVEATWLRRKSAREATSVRVGLNGETESKHGVDNYWTSVRFRRNVYRPWLFYELEPGLRWPAKEDYDTTPFLNARLEILLDQF